MVGVTEENKVALQKAFDECLSKSRTAKGHAKSLTAAYLPKRVEFDEYFPEQMLSHIMASWFIIQNAVIDFLSPGEQTFSADFAIRVFRLCQFKKIPIDENMYASVISLCTKGRAGKAPEKIFDLMKKSGILPSATLYSQYVNSLTLATTPVSTQLSKSDSQKGKSLSIDWSSVSMSAINFCSNCKSELRDEEIMVGWSYDGIDYSTQCVCCAENRFIPMLKIKYFVYEGKRKRTGSDVYGEEKGEDGEIDISIPYLSPMALRLESENASKVFKEDLSDLSTLRRMHPDLFWNLLWYFYHQELPMESLIGSQAAAEIRLVPFYEENTDSPTNLDSQTSAAHRRTRTISMSSPVSFSQDQIAKSLKNKDFPGAMRMFLRNRINSTQKKWKSSMYRALEDIAGIDACAESIDNFASLYKKAFVGLPVDLEKNMIPTDKPSGTAIRRFRAVFKHWQYYSPLSPFR